MSPNTPRIDLESKEKFGDSLVAAGMPRQRSRVFARLDGFGMTNGETAAELDKDTSTISNYYTDALADISDARKLAHYTHKPEYISELPDGIASQIERDHPVAFSLHRPVSTGEGRYTIAQSDVIEAFYTDDDAYLLRYHRPGPRNRSRTRHFALESRFLVRFIHDWLVTNRYPATRESRGREDLADRWFLTDVFEPEWLEEKLAQVGVSRIEVIASDEFTNPLEEPVKVHDAALTGTTHDGYTVGYRPTGREIADLLASGEISETEAEDITRCSASQLRELV